jgi:hypothetical protein
VEKVEIVCRCKDCIHSGKSTFGLYCYYWDYESGMSPNSVDEEGFCYNAEAKKE